LVFTGDVVGCLDFCFFKAVDWWFELVGGFREFRKSFFFFRFFSVGWCLRTCAKYLAKACAFSALPLAQVPCVVLIGGDDLAIFHLLVAFPKERWILLV
jgi:hypothetical protein